MAMIIERIGDKAQILAAHLNMLSKLNSLQQTYHKIGDAMLQLLYEWKNGGGCREDLVKALENVDLRPLAEQ